MLFTPSHAELAQHPKMRKLARLLGVGIPTAIGHLHLLWHFALKYAPDGDLGRFDCDEIADGCLWEGAGDDFQVALVAAGWLDREGEAGVTIHDWDEYGGKYVKRKEANAERMRETRAKQPERTTAPRATHVQRTTDARAALEKNRVEEKREEESNPPPNPPAPVPLRPAAAPPARPEQEPPGFVAFWKLWPKKEGKAAALAKWRTLKPDPATTQAILDAIPRQQAAKDWPRENWRYCPLPATWLHQRRWEDEVPEPVPREQSELIGKDKERAEVMRRVLARRGYERTGTDATPHANGREVSHQPLRIGDGRLS